MTDPKLNIIFAGAYVGDHGPIIGYKGDLPWGTRVPGDLKWFQSVTQGHVVIMGRKTWESLPLTFRPLRDRTNIVVSRNPKYELVGGQLDQAAPILCRSPLAAYSSAEYHISGDPLRQIFVIGGATLYNLFMPLAHRIYKTRVGEEYLSEEAANDLTNCVYAPRLSMSSWRAVSSFPLTPGIDDLNDGGSVRVAIWERKPLSLR